MKRFRIFVSVAMCTICLSLLAIGVYAAVLVNFQINSSLIFNPEGVYVEMSGQVYRGSTAYNLEPVYDDSRNYTMEKTMNYIVEDGQMTGSFELEPWNPGAVYFLPTQKFVQYRVTIKNLSDESISVSSSGLTNITGVTKTEQLSDVLNIAPNDTADYTLTFQCTSSTALNSVNFSVSLTIQKLSALIEAQKEYVTFENEGSVLTKINFNKSGLETIVIPREINGVEITSEGWNESTSGGPWGIFDYPNASTIKTVIIDAQLETLDGLFDYDYTSNPTSPTIYVLPDSLKEITDLFGTQLCEIKIPDNVNKIYLLSECPITKMNIPYSVKNLTLSGYNFNELDMTKTDWNQITLSDNGFYPASCNIYISNNANLTLVKSKLTTLSSMLTLINEDGEILAEYDGASWN